MTQANRVFLMEPCFNPALESQAIGRVHRLGQKREVEIIRMVVKDSVETRLLKYMQRKYGSAPRAVQPAASSEDADSMGEDGAGDEGSGETVERVTKTVAPSRVGNITTDKASMMTVDFDLLFDVPSNVQT